MRLTATMTSAALIAALSAPLVALAQPAGDASIVAHDAAPAADAALVAAGEAAPAAGAPHDAASDADPVRLGVEIYGRIRSGEWLPALAAVLVLLVWGIRRFASKFSKWFETRAGGYTVSLITSLSLTFAAAFNAGEPFSVGLLTAAVGAAWAAAGGFEALRDLMSGGK